MGTAPLQSKPVGTGELAIVLALVRAGTLAGAAQRAGVDASTVFRTVQRLEKAIGRRLFERSRAGYRPDDAVLSLARHAEDIESALEAARAELQHDGAAASGTVRITTTDTLLAGLVLPALASLHAAHPLLRLEVTARNELANLTQREADIALRATRRPPPQLVGRRLGAIGSVIAARKPAGRRRLPDPADSPWVAVDDALPEHPSVRWRRRHLPRIDPALQVNGVQSVFDAVAAGIGVGIVPLFLLRTRADVVALTPPLPECETDLWLLTHPESRHLRRIATVAAHLAGSIVLT